MRIKIKIQAYFNDESGAVTVDWVVLTAAVIGLGGAVMASVGVGGMDLADDIKANLEDTKISSYLPVPTFGEAVDSVHIDNSPRQCTEATPAVLAMDVDGNITEQSPAVEASCNTDVMVSGGTTWYAMSDGTQWTKQVRTTHTFLTPTLDSEIESETVITWRDQDAEIVEAPEAS